MKKISKSEMLDLHPGFRAMQESRRGQRTYAWLEHLVFPKRLCRVTQLIRCPRQRWYMAHGYEKTVAGNPLASEFRMMRGSLLHAALAQAAPLPGTERLLWADTDSDWVIAGTPDLVMLDGPEAVIVDYKTVGRLPKEPDPMHVLQLRLYAWLLQQNGCQRELDGLEVYHSNADGLTGFRFPLPNIRTHKVLDWLAEAEADDIPPAQPTALWECSVCEYAQCERHGPSQERPAVQQDDDPDPYGFANPEGADDDGDA